MTENQKNIDEKLDGLTIHEPVKLKYCDICHFPEEYCEYTHNILFKKASQHMEVSQVTEGTQIADDEEMKEGTPIEIKEEQKGKTKGKKVKESYISIELQNRGKQNHITYVHNLEKFGLNLKDVAKLFSKKFACSSTVTKEGGEESIALTGEFGYEIVDFITEKFPFIKPEMCFKVKEPSKKKNK